MSSVIKFQPTKVVVRRQYSAYFITRLWKSFRAEFIKFGRSEERFAIHVNDEVASLAEKVDIRLPNQDKVPFPKVFPTPITYKKFLDTSRVDEVLEKRILRSSPYTLQIIHLFLWTIKPKIVESWAEEHRFALFKPYVEDLDASFDVLDPSDLLPTTVSLYKIPVEEKYTQWSLCSPSEIIEIQKGKAVWVNAQYKKSGKDNASFEEISRKEHEMEHFGLLHFSKKRNIAGHQQAYFLSAEQTRDALKNPHWKRSGAAHDAFLPIQDRNTDGSIAIDLKRISFHAALGSVGAKLSLDEEYCICIRSFDRLAGTSFNSYFKYIKSNIGPVRDRNYYKKIDETYIGLPRKTNDFVLDLLFGWLFFVEASKEEKLLCENFEKLKK
ncbi:hypothetical protein [uncultured Roseibium sp.]|uniref:hypothetical protein n=1 Tax=uncultured Roseibium sp. TaxID=1936171 RepID=UPI00261C86F6|nr:hypothetical protein [uncultured Roseibium sp.]